MPDKALGHQVLRMEVTRFFRTWLHLPCQILRTGRRVVYRLLQLTPTAWAVLAIVTVLTHLNVPERCPGPPTPCHQHRAAAWAERRYPTRSPNTALEDQRRLRIAEREGVSPPQGGVSRVASAEVFKKVEKVKTRYIIQTRLF
jgi:hypothetical protein